MTKRAAAATPASAVIPAKAGIQGFPLRLLLAVAVSWVLLASAIAKEAAPLAADPVVEQRLIAISEEMRCLVCQNESLAGSRADLAMDLKRELREQIRQGKSDAEIRAFMVSRYGDFVLYRPPLKATTWLLWIGPFVLVVVGLAVLVTYLRRRRQAVPPARLSEEERRRATALLEEKP